MLNALFQTMLSGFWQSLGLPVQIDLSLLRINLGPGAGGPWLKLPMRVDVGAVRVGSRAKPRWRWPFLRVGIDQLSVRMLRHESFRLEAIGRKLEREVARIDGDQRTLFDQGKESDAPHQRLALARTIQELDARRRSIAQDLAGIDQHRRLVEGLVRLKERQERRQNLWDGSLNPATPGKLVNALEREAARERDVQAKLDQMHAALGAALAAPGDASAASPLVRALADAMAEARSAEAAGRPDAVAAAARKVDALLATSRENPPEQ